MYAATSDNDGGDWKYRRLITPGDCGGKAIESEGWTGSFTPSDTFAEPKGYLSSVQSRDGTIHVFSSGLHYRFNYEWLTEK